MRTRPIPAALLLLTALLISAVPAAAKKKNVAIPADHPMLELMARASFVKGRQHRALLVYPISRDVADPAQVRRPATSAEAASAENLSIGEPEKKPGRGPVELFNWSKEPILLLAGELLEGGVRDRFLSRDVLLSGGERVSAPAYTADRKERDDEDASRVLKPMNVLVPDFLRLVAVTDGPRRMVERFIEEQFGVAGEKLDRRPLPALYRSAKIAERMKEYRTVFQAIPDEAGKRVVGCAALVGDRFVGIDLFGSNASFRAHWPQILSALALEAALYEAAYGLLARPFPAVRDPDRHLVRMKGMLKKLFAARMTEEEPVDAGEEISFSRDELVGRALLRDGELLHAVIVPDFLTAAPGTEPPPGSSPQEYTQGELERRAERGTLTEAEKRLLERMRERNRRPPKPQRPPDRGDIPLPTPGGGGGGGGD